MNILKQRQIGIAICAAWYACIVSPLIGASPIDQVETDQAIEQVRQGGNLARADLVRNLIELKSRNASGVSKLGCLQDLIRLGAAVLETRDVAIDTNANVSAWPNFDARAFGAEQPVFAGTNPESIQDAKVREAYKRALISHHETLAKYSAERKKTEVADEALRASRKLMLELGTEDAKEHARRTLSGLTARLWITEHINRTLFPVSHKATDDAQPAGLLDKDVPNPKATAALQVREQPSSSRQAVETNDSIVGVQETIPTSLFAWVIAAILAAIALRWLIPRRTRKK